MCCHSADESYKYILGKRFLTAHSETYSNKILKSDKIVLFFSRKCVCHVDLVYFFLFYHGAWRKFGLC